MVVRALNFQSKTLYVRIYFRVDHFSQYIARFRGHPTPNEYSASSVGKLKAF